MTALIRNFLPLTVGPTPFPFDDTGALARFKGPYTQKLEGPLVARMADHKPRFNRRHFLRIWDDRKNIGFDQLQRQSKDPHVDTLLEATNYYLHIAQTRSHPRKGNATTLAYTWRDLALCLLFDCGSREAMSSILLGARYLEGMFGVEEALTKQTAQLDPEVTKFILKRFHALPSILWQTTYAYIHGDNEAGDLNLRLSTYYAQMAQALACFIFQDKKIQNPRFDAQAMMLIDTMDLIRDTYHLGKENTQAISESLPLIEEKFVRSLRYEDLDSQDKKRLEELARRTKTAAEIYGKVKKRITHGKRADYLETLRMAFVSYRAAFRSARSGEAWPANVSTRLAIAHESKANWVMRMRFKPETQMKKTQQQVSKRIKLSLNHWKFMHSSEPWNNNPEYADAMMNLGKVYDFRRDWLLENHKKAARILWNEDAWVFSGWSSRIWHGLVHDIDSGGHLDPDSNEADIRDFKAEAAHAYLRASQAADNEEDYRYTAMGLRVRPSQLWRNLGHAYASAAEWLKTGHEEKTEEWLNFADDLQDEIDWYTEHVAGKEEVSEHKLESWFDLYTNQDDIFRELDLDIGINRAEE